MGNQRHCRAVATPRTVVRFNRRAERTVRREPDHGTSGIDRLLNELDAALASSQTSAPQLETLVRFLVAVPTSTYQERRVRVHPVTEALIEATRSGADAATLTAALCEVAHDAPSRVRARTALLALGEPEIAALVVLYRDDATTARAPLPSTFDPAVFLRRDAVMLWSPELLSDMRDIPEAVGSLFPIDDLPVYQYYCSLQGNFEFEDHEVDLLRLIRSAGVDTIDFADGIGLIKTAQAGIEVAFNDWLMADEVGDLRQIADARAAFVEFFRAGGHLDPDFALDGSELFIDAYATYAEAFSLVWSDGTDVVRAEILRSTAEVLARPLSDELRPAAVASHDQLRTCVHRLSQMYVSRSEPSVGDTIGR